MWCAQFHIPYFDLEVETASNRQPLHFYSLAMQHASSLPLVNFFSIVSDLWGNKSTAERGQIVTE